MKNDMNFKTPLNTGSHLLPFNYGYDYLYFMNKSINMEL